MRSTCALYALSGFVCLSYQVSWFRIFVDRFGSTNLTFILVICCFIGGLGIGALLSQRLAARIGARDPLRTYGVIELGVAAAAALTVAARCVPPGIWGPFPYHLDGDVWVHAWSYRLLRVAIVALCVLPPCVLMGTTFPLLCRRGVDAGFPSRLYAWNTFGACSGVLVTQLVLLPGIGHDRAYELALALNVALALAAIAAGRGTAEAPIREEQAVPETGPDWLMGLAALSGLTCGALEADMFKRVSFVGGNSSAGMALVSFWAIVAIFVGSRLARRPAFGRADRLGWLAGLGVLLYAGMWDSIYVVQAWLIERAGAGGGPVVFPTSVWQLVLMTGLIVFPGYLLWSISFPYVCDRLQRDPVRLGRACGLNTLCFCAGTLLFGWLTPQVSVFFSMKLTVVLAGAATVAVAARNVHGCAIALALMVAGAAYVDRGFDARYVNPADASSRYPVHSLLSDGSCTTYVVEDPAGPKLYFDNHSMSGTNKASATYMQLMAHAALLAKDEPQRALLIGFGCGNTAAAVAEYATVREIDVVELDRKVIRTAPAFARANREVYRDPRLRFIHDDGRNFLKITDRTYDLITSEPPPPMMPGIYRLYSSEYYAAVRSHLTPNGLMTQWLPVDELPARAVELITSTFLDAFQHTLLLTGFGENFILVGCQRPIDLPALERRLTASPAIRRGLKKISIRTPIAFLSRIVQSDAELRARYENRGRISDQRNDLEYLFWDPRAPAIIPYDPLSLIAKLDVDRLTHGPRLRQILSHLGRLDYRVPDFPCTSLSTLPASSSSRIALANVDWCRVHALKLTYQIRLISNQLAEAEAVLLELLSLSPEQPRVLLELARLRERRRDYATALACIEQFRRIEPLVAEGFSERGRILSALGRREEARADLERALEIDPYDEATRTELARLTQPASKSSAPAQRGRDGPI